MTEEPTWYRGAFLGRNENVKNTAVGLLVLAAVEAAYGPDGRAGIEFRLGCLDDPAPTAILTAVAGEFGADGRQTVQAVIADLVNAARSFS